MSWNMQISCETNCSITSFVNIGVKAVWFLMGYMTLDHL